MVIPGRGFIMNNTMADFSAKVGVHTTQGLELDEGFSPDAIQTAPDSRKYVSYALYNQDAVSGSSYSLHYYLYYYGGSVLYNGVCTTYVDTDGEVLYNSETTHTVPSSGSTELETSPWPPGTTVPMTTSSRAPTASPARLVPSPTPTFTPAQLH